MKHKRISSIRTRLAWLVAACVVPAFIMAGALVYAYYGNEQAKSVRDAAASVNALTFDVDRELVSLETVLFALATSPHLTTRNLAAFDQQARELVKDRRIENVILADTSSQQLINTRRPAGTPLPRVGDPELVKRALFTQQPVISDLFIGQILKQPLISIGVPIILDEQVVYVLIASILPQRFAEVLMQQRVMGGLVELLDRSGKVIAQNRALTTAVGQLAPQPLLREFRNSSQGEVVAATPEGGSAVVVFSRSPYSGWTVIKTIPDENLVGDLWRTAGWLMGALLLLLGTSLMLAWSMGGRIADSIRSLRSPAAELGYNRAVTVPELPIREVNEIGQAIEKASLMLTSTRASLAGSEARMSAILESAMDAIITLDDNQTIVLFNSAACEMFGCTAAEAIGAPGTRFIPERFHARHADYIEKHRESGEASGQAVALRCNGQEFPVEVSYSNVIESGLTFHTLIIRDVTGRIRAFEALERSNQDLQQFAYVASHDLKTPLRSIGGFLQMLQKGQADTLDAKALSLISRSLESTRRLEQLTDDLLSYARVNAEVRPFTPVHCGEVANDVIQLLDAAIRDSGAVVTVGDLPRVVGDRTQLVQLLLNLIGNGLKYCQGRTPVVHLSAIKNAGDWVFSIADNGIGIEARHHEKIFEVFKRLHTQKEYAGTGIGLAVCRRVVERHGGKIWLTSALGEGSTFHFTIPDLPAESTAA